MSELRRALDGARVDRASALRGEALARDTLHRVDRCTACARVARRVAVLPDGSGGDDADAVRAWVEAMRDGLPAAEVDCGCAARVTLAALAYHRTIHGRGVHCALEGVAGDDGWRWSWRLGAVDGVMRVCAMADLPALATRARWREILSAGAAGATPLEPLEAGLWAFAGPREGGLEARVKDLVASLPRGRLVPQKLFAWRAVVPAAEAWTGWATPWSDAIRDGSLRAGAVVDLDALAALVGLAAVNAGMSVDDADAQRPALQRDGLSRSVDLERLALSVVFRGDGLAEGAARVVAHAAALFADARAVEARVRAMRPSQRFAARGWSLVPLREDGTEGPAVPLPERVGAAPSDEELERAVRFACDVLPPWSDPSRVCACGAPAGFVARLLSAATVQALAGTAAVPVVLARWPETDPRAVLVAGVGCETHTWFPGEEALAAQGITRDEVLARVRADAPLATFAFEAEVVTEGDARAVVARGHHLASAMSDDHYVTALHRACDAPLRGPQVGALAVGTGTLVLHERGWSAEALDRLCTAVALGVVGDGLLVSRDARVDALPRGRMVRRGGAL